jgi:acyl-CoA thioester hydrolase
VVAVDGAVERVGRTSFVVAMTVSVAERLCCRVRTTYVLVDADRTPVPVPDDVRARWVSPVAAP